MTKDAFPEQHTGTAHDADLVAFGTPVDADNPFKIVHGVLHSLVWVQGPL